MANLNLSHAKHVQSAWNSVESLYAERDTSWRGKLWLGRISLWLGCEYFATLEY